MNFPQFFKKTLFTEHPQVTAPADSSVPAKVLSIDHTLFFPSFFFLLLTISIMGVYLESVLK